MSNATKLLHLASLFALTLVAACDTDLDSADTDGLDANASEEEGLRSGSAFIMTNYYNNPKSGVRLNTNNLGDWPFSEFRLDGSMLDHVALLNVRTAANFGQNRPAWERDDIPHDTDIDLVNGSLDLSVNPEHMLVGTVDGGGVWLQHGDFNDSLWTVQLDQEFIQDLDAVGIAHDGSGRLDLRLEVDWIYPENIEIDLQHFDEDYDEYELVQMGAIPVYKYWYIQNHESTPTCTSSTIPGVQSAAAVLYRDLSVDDHDGTITNRSDTLQIACIQGAVGKVAAKWDYWPETMDPNTYEGQWRPEFELAVRVVRSDYCGDGVSFTQPGTPVEVFDNHAHTATPDYPNDIGQWRPTVEAVWADSRALCLDHTRIVGAAPNCGIPACNGKTPAFDWILSMQDNARFVTRTDRILELNVP